MQFNSFHHHFTPYCCSQVMAGCPLPASGRGDNVLKLLKVLAPILQPNLVEMWDTVIPKLMQYLEGASKLQEMCIIDQSLTRHFDFGVIYVFVGYA